MIKDGTIIYVTNDSPAIVTDRGQELVEAMEKLQQIPEQWLMWGYHDDNDPNRLCWCCGWYFDGAGGSYHIADSPEEAIDLAYNEWHRSPD